MRTIHKFPVHIDDLFTHIMPATAKILSVMVQRCQACMWVELDTDDTDHVSRTFHVVGTGNPVPDGVVYHGSWVAEPFVWHLYETPIPKEPT